MKDLVCKSSSVVPGIFVGMSILATTGCDQPVSGKYDNPNIILIVADDLGINDVSFFRNLNRAVVPLPPTSETPHLDLLAEQGIAFTDFYCGAAVCSPSRAALLTGRNATRVGVYNWIPVNSPMHLRKDEITLAEILKIEGYQTAHFGKWHLTSDFDSQPGPLEQGYDYGFYTQNNAEPSHHNPINFIRNGERTGPLEGYASHLVMDETIAWLEGKKDLKTPFYINIWFHEPHVVCAAPEEYTSRHAYRQDYYGSIENMDAAIGRLLAYMANNGLDENTLIMFSSDNGSQELYSNLPFKGKKALNLEGGVKTPFIARWVGTLTPGKVCSATGSYTDILPTLARLTGAKVPEDRVIDGESLLPAFENPGAPFKREKPIFFYRYFHDPICVLRDGDWLLTGYEELFDYHHDINIRDLAKFKPAEGEPRWAQWGFQQSHMQAIPMQEPRFFRLHNVKNDPGQTDDLVSKYPEKVEQMKQTMLALRKEMIEEGGNWFALDDAD